MFTKGKGAKMFEKRKSRMDKYTREVSDEQARATKQAALEKKKLIESGQYQPANGPMPMAPVLPQGPVVLNKTRPYQPGIMKQFNRQFYNEWF